MLLKRLLGRTSRKVKMQIKTLKAEKHKFGQTEGQLAEDRHYQTLITESTLIECNGKIVAAYLLSGWDYAPLREVCQTTKYVSPLQNGLRTQSRQFGFQKTGPTSFHTKCPEKTKVLIDYAERITEPYKTIFPSNYDKQLRGVNAFIDPNCRLGATPFTNGILNKNSPLRYHYDVGNFDTACTCIYGLQNNCVGGYLVFPALRIAFEMKDCSIAIFDGFELLHGVTPIKMQSENAYRYTVVYYTLH